jgi:archaellin
VIIQTGEKLQQNAQQTGSDTQQEISGKISIVTAWVGSSTAVLVLVFETAAGSEVISNDMVYYNVICGGAANAAFAQGDFSLAENLDETGAGTFDQGVTYMIDIDITNCPATIGDQDTLLISVEGGGSTYELLQYTGIVQGDPVI